MKRIGTRNVSSGVLCVPQTACLACSLARGLHCKRHHLMFAQIPSLGGGGWGTARSLNRLSTHASSVTRVHYALCAALLCAICSQQYIAPSSRWRHDNTPVTHFGSPKAPPLLSRQPPPGGQHTPADGVIESIASVTEGKSRPCVAV